MRLFKLKNITALVLACIFVLGSFMPAFAEYMGDILNPGIVIVENDFTTATALQRFNAVRRRFYTHTEVADKMTIIGISSTRYVFNTPSYAYLAAKLLKDIEKGITDTTYTYEFIEYREEYSADTFKSPMVSKALYLDLADRILKHKEENGNLSFDVISYPNETITNYSGNICMLRAAGVLSWALSYYYNNGVLPEYVTSAYHRTDIAYLELKEDSRFILDYSVDYLTNVPAGTTVKELKAQFTNDNLFVADNKGTQISDENAIVKSGWCIYYLNEEKILDSIVIQVNGDINCDGSSNNDDIKIIADAVFAGNTFSGITMDMADSDLNKKINMLDLLGYQREVNFIRTEKTEYTYTEQENMFYLTMDKASALSGEEFTMTVSASPTFKARNIGGIDFSIRIDPARVEIVSVKLPEVRSENTYTENRFSESLNEMRIIWTDAVSPIPKIENLMQITFKAKQDIPQTWTTEDEILIYFARNKSMLTDAGGNEYEYRASRRLQSELPQPTQAPKGEAEYTISEVASAFAKAEAEFRTTGKLPETITFGNITANKASYFRLACEAIANLLDSNENMVQYYTCKEPENVEDKQMSSNSMSKTAYAYAVRRNLEVMNAADENGNSLNTPANIIAISQTYETYGNFDYNRAALTFMRVLAYYHEYGVLPANINIAWEEETYVLADEIINAAKTVMESYETSKELPKTVNVGNTSVTITQYFDLAAKVVNELYQNKFVHRVVLQNCTELSWLANDTFITENTNNLITKDAYMHMVNTQLEAMDKYSRRQPLLTVEYNNFELACSGEMNFAHQTVILSRILRSYRKFGVLPLEISADYSTAAEVYSIPTDLAISACRVLYDAYDADPQAKIPSSRLIGYEDENGNKVEYVLKQATYTKMAAKILTMLLWDSRFEKLPKTITVEKTNEPAVSYKWDTYSFDEITKEDYLALARSYVKFADGHANNAPQWLYEIGDNKESVCFDRITVILLRAVADLAARHKLTRSIYSEFTLKMDPKPTPTPTPKPTTVPTDAPTAIPTQEATAEPALTPEATPMQTLEPVEEDKLAFIASSGYTIDAENKLLLGVEAETSIEKFLSMAVDSQNVIIYDKNGNNITQSSEFVTTGTVVKLVKDGIVCDELTIAVLGDINCDGKINSRDLAAMQKMIIAADYSNIMLFNAANLTGDEKVNSRDIAALQKHIIGQ